METMQVFPAKYHPKTVSRFFSMEPMLVVLPGKWPSEWVDFKQKKHQKKTTKSRGVRAVGMPTEQRSTLQNCRRLACRPLVGWREMGRYGNRPGQPWLNCQGPGMRGLDHWKLDYRFVRNVVCLFLD